MGATIATRDAGTVHDWRDRFPCLMLLDAFWLAMTPTVLALALAGAVLTSCGWWLSDALWISDEAVASSPVLTTDTHYLGSFPGSRQSAHGPLHLDESQFGKWVMGQFGVWPETPLTAIPVRMLRPFIRLTQPAELKVRLYYLCGAAWAVAVWAVFGAAITRISILHFGRGERLGFSRAIRFSSSRFVSQVGAMLMPVAGIATVALPLVLLGLLMRWSPMVVVAGLSWVFFLPLGLVMAVMALGWMFGWPLTWGAICCEDQDAYDAVARSYSYTFQRPIRYALYVAVGIVFGTFGWLIVWYASELVIHLAGWGVSIGTGPDRMNALNDVMGGLPNESTAISVGGRLFGFWQSVVRALAGSYAAGYFWCVMSGIYLLLRYDVDSTEFDEIYSGSESTRYFDLTHTVGDESS